MIYKLIIGVLLLATILYYYFCFLEIFGVIKFTGRHTTVRSEEHTSELQSQR